MKDSPLQLLRYFTPEICCSANPSFDPQKVCEAGVDQFSVNAVVTRQTAADNFPGHSWCVEMHIAQKYKDGQNFPYKFDVTLIGFFACSDGFPSPADEGQFVRVNGSSMLYGAARELLRSLTSRGPWSEVFLPGISFYDKNSKPPGEPPAPAQAT